MATAGADTRTAETSKPSSSQFGKLAPGNRIGPDGVILGPDGKPCRACNSLKAFGSVASQKSSKGKGTTAAGAAAASIAAIASTSAVDDEYKACPPDVEQLGRHTWTFLHSTAAYYPEQPTPQHKEQASALFNALPTLYPCRHCADELQNEMQRIGPADVANGQKLSNWLCRIHNEVNVRLGKPEFDCTKVFKRWLEGWDDGRCE